MKVKCNGGGASPGVGQGCYLSKDVEEDGLRIIWNVGTECQKNLSYLWEILKKPQVLLENSKEGIKSDETDEK